MKEFDKQNFYILLGLSLVWFYFVFEYRNIWANLSIAATAFSLYLFVTKIYEERSGFFSVLFFLSTLGVGMGANFSGRGAFATLLLTALFLLYLWNQYWYMYPILTVGAWLCGIWFLIFFLIVIFLHCILVGKVERLGEMHLLRGILIVTLCQMPFNLEFLQNLSFDSFWQIFALTKLLPQIKYPVQMNGVGMLVLLGCLLLPWLIFFIRSIFLSVSDCRNEELENHLLMHLWWILGIAGIFCLGKEFYPLLMIIFPPIAILLGWSSQRLEKNFNPVKELSSVPVWDCSLAFILLGFVWHYLGGWNGDLLFESNFIAILMIVFALIAVFAYYKFKDLFLFLLIQLIAGIIQICFFYIYFYPVVLV